jgi:hypothetical protein
VCHIYAVNWMNNKKTVHLKLILSLHCIHFSDILTYFKKMAVNMYAKNVNFFSLVLFGSNSNLKLTDHTTYVLTIVFHEV